MTFPKTHRSTIKRLAERGHYDKETVCTVLDAGLIAHIGIAPEGQPVVIPVMYGRKGDEIYFHGAKASRLLKYIETGRQVCVTVTLLDGLVLARSLFEHSMNYRSVVAYGTGRRVDDSAEKLEALQVIADKMLPGRWEDARKPTSKELKATSVVAVRIEEASAKIRTGGAHDFEEDLGLLVWAGVVPIRETYGTPLDNEDLDPAIEVPAYLSKQINSRK